MYLETPVIAINNGGPLESIKDGETGFLVKQDPVSWADKMNILYKDDSMR